MAEVTRASVYATLSTLLAGYDSEAVQRRSVSGFDVPSFFNGKPNTLYLCAPPDEQHQLAPIFTALIRRVISEAYHRQAVGEKTLPLLLLLDEAGNIATIEDLDTLAITAAGTQIQLVSVFHDLAQMHAIYQGGRADSIANNHSAQMLLPNNRDPRTAEWFRAVLDDDRGGSVHLRSLRRMADGTALCVYDNLAAEMVQLRSSDHDADLLAMAGPTIVGDPAFEGYLALGPAPAAEPDLAVT